MGLIGQGKDQASSNREIGLPVGETFAVPSWSGDSLELDKSLFTIDWFYNNRRLVTVFSEKKFELVLVPLFVAGLYPDCKPGKVEGQIETTSSVPRSQISGTKPYPMNSVRESSSMEFSFAYCSKVSRSLRAGRFHEKGIFSLVPFRSGLALFHRKSKPARS